MRKRVLLSFGVRLSVTLVYCIQMAEDIVKLSYLPGSPMILEAPIPNSKGNPSAGTLNTRVWENFAIFDC